MKNETVHNRQCNNTCFAIDLHGVVLQLNIAQMALILLRSGQLHRFVLLGCNIFFWIAMIRQLRTQQVVEQAFNELLIFPQFKAVQETAFAIINAQQPRPAVVQLLRELQQQGDTLVICSNIGPRSMALLATQFPELFALFSDCITPQQPTMVSKPDKAVYQLLVERHAAHHRRIILIDDRLANNHAATPYGIIALHYQGLSRLRRTLNTLLQSN